MNHKLETVKVNPSLSWISFLLFWILIYVIGWLIVSVLGDYALVLLGAIVGGLQWILIRQHVSFWWIVVTGISLPLGYMAGLFISALIMFSSEPGSDSDWVILGHVIGGVLGGGLVGLAQWSVLRQRVAQAKWWILAVSIGWILGLYVIRLFDHTC